MQCELPYCEKKIINSPPNKKFCTYRHNKIFTNIKVKIVRNSYLNETKYDEEYIKIFYAMKRRYKKNESFERVNELD